MASRRRGNSLFVKSLLLLVVVMAFITGIALIYVYNALVMYETNDITNYMDNFTSTLKKDIASGKMSKYIAFNDVSNEYEKKPSLNEGYKELIKGKELTYKKTKDDNVYDIYAGEDKILTVTLDGSKTTTKLALLTLTLWEVKDYTGYSENGLYQVDLYALNNYKVKINNIDIKEANLKEEAKLEGFEDAYKFVELPKINHYVVNNLTKKPEVKVYDENNKEVSISENNNALYALNEVKIADAQTALTKLNGFDPLKVAETWSLLLTNDARFSTLSQNLIKDTDMYTKAYKWATGIDITFTSAHRLQNPAFTNEFEKNFVFYDDNTFSVEVNLEKNLFLKSGEERKIPLHEIFYFTYYDNAYRLISMKSVTE